MYYWCDILIKVCDILIKVLKVMNQAAYIIGGYNTRHDSFSIQNSPVILLMTKTYETQITF